MRTMLRTLVTIAILALLSGPLSAHANIIYDWTGHCNGVVTPGIEGCSGQATLHVVTTDDYIPGETFTPHFACIGATCTPVATPVLLEFLYTDANSPPFDYTLSWLFDSGNFQLPALLPGETGPGEGELLTTAQVFTSHSDGSWRAAGEDRAPNCDAGNPPGNNPFCGYGARGSNGLWTRAAVPESSTLTLLGVGILGLGVLRSRKRLLPQS